MKQTIMGLVAAMAACTLIGGCSTVKIPKFEMPSLPAFKEATEKLLDGYPEVADAPTRPKDVRSAEEWDKAAKALMTERSGFVVPDLGDSPQSETEVAREVERLKAQVRAYKLDDPQ
jgi:hypothetical protein